MNSTFILLLATIVLLILIFPLLFFLRRRVELKIEEEILLLQYPLSTKRIDLLHELESWSVEKSYYIRWGIFHSLSLKFKSGKRLAVSSLMNQDNYDLLYNHLAQRFPGRRM